METSIYFFTNSDDGLWKNTFNAIKGITEKVLKEEIRHSEILSELNTNIFSNNDSPSGILVLPLFTLSDGNTIEAKGLEFLKEFYSKKLFNFRTIFLVCSSRDIPNVDHPEAEMAYYASNIIKNPAYGKTEKALFLAEFFSATVESKEKNKEKNVELTNVINLMDKDFPELWKETVKQCLNRPKILPEWKKAYYDAYISFYEQRPTTEGLTVGKEELKKVNKYYNEINGIHSHETAHHDELELFRAPIPFPLQEMADAYTYVSDILGAGGSGQKKIKLLLIDNKADKFSAGSPRSLPRVFEKFHAGRGQMPPNRSIPRVFEKFQVKDLFTIEMLGEKDHGDKAFDEKYETFDFARFRNPQSPLAKDEEEYHSSFLESLKREKNLTSVTYRELVYHRIVKSAHFVLLDFFLDNDNIYLAFDFINEICQMKREAGDYSTTWFFITSAVYDSVVKYSQSGLLAEYYESAVVSAGDDPTNEKRRIIFIYKLLTFIKSRISAFKRYKDSIDEKLLRIVKSDKNQGGEQQNFRKEFSKGLSPPCPKEDCLRTLQIHIKKYLTEFDDIASIFYDKDFKEIKIIMESLDNLINQFIWLPEADWHIIQHQVDFINEKLKKLTDKNFDQCKFSCNYIIEELRERSEVY